MSYLINQRAWYVARENYKNHTVEYLDDKRDVFYVEGVQGYPTKAEAQMRADNFQGDKRGVFLIGPNYGRYNLTDNRANPRKSFNVQLTRLQLMDRVATPETVDELRQMIRDFALTHGVWCMSNISLTRDLLTLVRKYNAITDAELVNLVYDTE